MFESQHTMYVWPTNIIFNPTLASIFKFDCFWPRFVRSAQINLPQTCTHTHTFFIDIFFLILRLNQIASLHQIYKLLQLSLILSQHMHTSTLRISSKHNIHTYITTLNPPSNFSTSCFRPPFSLKRRNGLGAATPSKHTTLCGECSNAMLCYCWDEAPASTHYAKRRQ